LSLAPHSGRIEGLAFGAESLLASAYSTSIKLSNATTGEAAGPNKAFSQDGFSWQTKTLGSVLQP
jgi:hypothetical protein